ncbi:hypothetical protein RB195_005714 [Necator americanus]|uniref:Cation efflux protein cytoplasmic domain-containing protein n=1 Tax=Necator americanus TaxID=51031 RepID=A0ABR1BT18_NECAM
MTSSRLGQSDDVVLDLLGLHLQIFDGRFRCKRTGFIIITWLMTVREQVPLLVGKTASPQLINRIVNVAISHDERIKHLDTVYVYHFGANFLVELHVVMDREITLCEAHDVSETLQAKLEQLSFVERAFVHCDYQFDGDEHV